MIDYARLRSASTYDRVENVLTELTPDPRHFEGSVYPPNDVKKDLRQLNNFRHTPEYKKNGERSDAKLLEKTFMDMVERGDWFGDEELYGEDSESLTLVTFPTAEIDDTFNHIDVINMINNEITGHETLPFAIDLTYNTDDNKMSRKFRWRHVYGKKKNAPERVSEFGENYTDKDYAGRNVIRTKALPLKFRYGLKIPGFASAKYFEDKNNLWDPMYPKGRINIMPRFIVGYSTDIADTLAGGIPTDEYRKKYGETAYQERRTEYKNAEKRAKWCTLFECSEQASNIRYMLENISSEETKWMYPKELEIAKKQIAAIDVYFANAIQLATDLAETNPDEKAAMEYANRDTVCQAIREHSNSTYLGKSW